MPDYCLNRKKSSQTGLSVSVNSHDIKDFLSADGASRLSTQKDPSEAFCTPIAKFCMSTFNECYIPWIGDTYHAGDAIINCILI